jgi:hypothetical protein
MATNRDTASASRRGSRRAMPRARTANGAT